MKGERSCSPKDPHDLIPVMDLGFSFRWICWKCGYFTDCMKHLGEYYGPNLEEVRKEKISREGRV